VREAEHELTICALEEEYSMQITWLGHSAFHISMKEVDILVDPFFTGNSTYPAGYEEKLSKVDMIALTHGHSDHLGDTVRLAEQFDATVIAIFEVVQYLGTLGLKKFQPMNIGGSIRMGDLTFSMVHAQHTSTIMKDGVVTALGDAAGLVISDGSETVYHAGDTGLFSDMALVQRLYLPSVGLIPIGDRFTMGPAAAAIACNEFLDLKYIIPTHWGTFPPLTGKPEDFKALVTRGEVLLPTAGETLTLNVSK
jgi:L-ascorbate metabolism protein UlaG (beta-lactamase superfamily)